MNETWLSGTKELLLHAEEHFDSNSDFDKRIAFISVDNAVENALRTFLKLPISVSLVQISRKEQIEYSSSFPKLLEGVQKYAKDKLVNINIGEVEYYHRIRNNLYHDGVGVTVEYKKLIEYKKLAFKLVESLFEVKYDFEKFDINDDLAISFFKHWSYLLERCEILKYGQTKKESNEYSHSSKIGELDLLYDIRIGLTELANWLNSKKLISNDLLIELTELEDLKRDMVWGRIIEKTDVEKQVLLMKSVSSALDTVIKSKTG